MCDSPFGLFCCILSDAKNNLICLHLCKMLYKCCTRNGNFKGVILPHRSGTDNRFAVRIRLTHRRQSVFLRTPYRLRPDEITAGGKIKTEEVRRQLTADVVTMESKVAGMGLRIDNFTARELGDILEREVAIKAGVIEQGIDIIAYGLRTVEFCRGPESRFLIQDFPDASTASPSSYRTPLI